MLKRIFYWALIVLGGLGIAATLNAALVSTGVRIGTLLPGCAGVVFIAYALVKLLRPGFIIKQRALRIIVTATVCVGILSFAAVETLLIVSANGYRPDREVSFVIVPGCGIFEDGRLTLTLKQRLNTAYDYLSGHEDAVCIVSGGQGEREPVPEADAMKEYLVSRGIDASRIATEPDSHDTKQNMKFSAGLMKSRFPGREMSAVVITSGFHMFRSVTLARNNGIKAYGIPAPTPWYMVLNDYMREFIGVIKLYALDLE